MAQRIEPRDSPDDFPTPPWATRALFENVLDDTNELTTLCCLEPACGAGHMARVLKEYFGQVRCSDAYDYGYGDVQDFLTYLHAPKSVDWIITNPPLRLAEPFIVRALSLARVGVAILARTVFLESVGRYVALFRDNPPMKVAQFTERVPMVKGRLDITATTATSYAWFVWQLGMRSISTSTGLRWVPPCRKQLERNDDYVYAHSSGWRFERRYDPDVQNLSANVFYQVFLTPARRQSYRTTNRAVP
jgi:hypothetical protein